MAVSAKSLEVIGRYGCCKVIVKENGLRWEKLWRDGGFSEQ